MILKRLMKFGKTVIDNRRTIMTGITIVGEAYAIVKAIQKGPKCRQILDELNARNATPKEKVTAIAKETWDIGLAFTISSGAAIANQVVASDIIAGLATTAGTFKTAYDIQKEVTKDVAGEETAKKIDDAVADKKLAEIKEDEIEDTGHGNDLFYEPLSGKLFRANDDYVKSVFLKKSNDLMKAHDKYGFCISDDYAVSLWDIVKHFGKRKLEVAEMLEIKARDANEIDYCLEGMRYEFNDGHVETGSKIIIRTPFNIAYTAISAEDCI